jgi:hypothetical protein
MLRTSNTKVVIAGPAICGIDRLARQHHEARGVVVRVLDVVLDHLQAIKFGGDARRDGGHGRIAEFGDIGRGAGGIGIGQRHDAPRAQEMARLAQRLRVAVGAGERAIAGGHQRGVDRQEVFAHDRQPAFGQQEVDVGDAAVLRILDRDDRLAGASVLHRIERVLERKARQRQAAGQRVHRRAVRIGARRALKRHGARGFAGGGGGHRSTRASAGAG